MALWTPLDLVGVTLVGWYRMRDPMGVVAQGADVFDGTKVTAWRDRSGRGNHLPNFTQYNAEQMALRPDGFGPGLASIHTGGIYWGTGWFGAIDAPNGKFGVMAALSQSDQQEASGSRLVSIGNVAGGNSGNQDYSQPNAILLYAEVDGGRNIASLAGGYAAVEVTPNTPLIVGSYYTGLYDGTRAHFLNGVETGTQWQDFDNQPRNLGLGTNGAYQGAYWVGEHAEYVTFVGPLVDAERDKLAAYLAWNNGTQASLSASNPYKNAPPTTSGGGGPVVIAPQRRRRLLILSS